MRGFQTRSSARENVAAVSRLISLRRRTYLILDRSGRIDGKEVHALRARLVDELGAKQTPTLLLRQRVAHDHVGLARGRTLGNPHLLFFFGHVSGLPPGACLPRLEPGYESAARALTRRTAPLERRSRTDRASGCVEAKRPLVFVLVGLSATYIDGIERR